MRRRAVPVAAMACIGMASACATRPTGKPLLTAAAAGRIRAECHADPGSFVPNRSGLPGIAISIPAAEQAADGVSPTMTCVHGKLQPYRYDMIQIVNHVSGR